METTVKAPAKINLYLRMDGTREDGYHLLYSVFQTLSLYDELRVSVLPREKNSSGSPIVIRSASAALPEDITKNTVYKAAKRYLDAISKDDVEVVIDLDKHIPSQAGLGGGSSDAAAVLLAMDKLFDGAVSRDELSKIAVSIGADVPFFLTGGTVLCEGIGEILTPLPDLSGLHVLLMKPPKGVSTPACYAAFDEIGAVPMTMEEKKTLKETLLGEGSSEERFRSAFKYWANDLEPAAIEAVPEIETGIRLMKEHGSSFAAMTGSGSCVFGFFEKEEKMDEVLSDQAFQALQEEGWWAEKVRTI
ncbi:MAG: 4-(cytidine 5'-diphospho)-2-C-methyl-D-erythritol kinase [Clostridiales bacterium]|nr:4-(cytidine 5'-diphospho)-2-C-methyl-D-erythritol kinase [Clostridiales bacterium]